MSGRVRGTGTLRPVYGGGEPAEGRPLDDTELVERARHDDVAAHGEPVLATWLTSGVAVRWRLAELEAQAERLRGTDSWFRTIPAVLRSYGVDVTTNRIRVRISSVNPLAAGMVEDHFGLSDMIDVESDGTGAMLLSTGVLRVLARDAAGHAVRGLRCEARPDIGEAAEDGGTVTDRAGRCRLRLPATGTWALLVRGSGPTRTVVGIGRAVVTPGKTSDLVVEVKAVR